MSWDIRGVYYMVLGYRNLEFGVWSLDFVFDMGSIYPHCLWSMGEIYPTLFFGFWLDTLWCIPESSSHLPFLLFALDNIHNCLKSRLPTSTCLRDWRLPVFACRRYLWSFMSLTIQRESTQRTSSQGSPTTAVEEEWQMWDIPHSSSYLNTLHGIRTSDFFAYVYALLWDYCLLLNCACGIDKDDDCVCERYSEMRWLCLLDKVGEYVVASPQCVIKGACSIGSDDSFTNLVPIPV